jgi:hypothetical protein
MENSETVEKLIGSIEWSLSHGMALRFHQNEGCPQSRDIDEALEKLDERKLEKIREIFITGETFEGFPESITKLKNLEHLTIFGPCIKTLPESIKNLSCLKTLYLQRFESSELEGYKAIVKLPALEELKLAGEYNSALILPSWIFQLTSLKKLNLSEITELPDAIGRLVSLRELDLSSCKITKLPDTISSLKSLKKLNLSYSALAALPESIGNLSNLEELDFSHTPVETLPDSIVKLKLLAVNRIKNIKLIHRVQCIVRKLSKRFNFIVSLQKFVYSSMYRKLDKFQQKLGVCGWHPERGIFVCRRKSDPCCTTGGTCGYRGPRGCTVDSLPCKFWICEKVMDYLDTIKSDKKHPLHKTCVRYLRMRISFDVICHALDIPLKGRASKFDHFDINNKYRENTYLERWFDNIFLRPFGQFISSSQAKTERISS